MATKRISELLRKRYEHYGNRQYVNISKRAGTTRGYTREVLIADAPCDGPKAQRVLAEAAIELKAFPKQRTEQ